MHLNHFFFKSRSRLVFLKNREPPFTNPQLYLAQLIQAENRSYSLAIEKSLY